MTDTAQVLRDLIAAAPAQGSSFRGAYPVQWPAGEYTVESTIEVDRPVDIDARGVQLVTPLGVDALRFVPSAPWSRIDGVTARAVYEFTPHAAVGIDVQAHGVTVERATARGMGYGLRVYGSAQIGANANCVQVRTALLYGCHEAGVHLKGGDANAGVFGGVEIIGGSQRTRVGVLDESFLGNTWVGLHVSSTREHGVRITPAANYSTHVGTYLENDCGTELPPGAKKIQCGVRVSWFGGNAIDHAPLGDRVGLGHSKVTFADIAPNGDTLQVTMPHAADHSYMAWVHTAAPGSGRPSGGVEALWRREPSRKTIELQTRAAGERRPVVSATRADAAEGHGICVASPRPAPADPTPVGLLSALPTAVVVGATVQVVDDATDTVQMWRGKTGPNGPYWAPLVWA